MIITLSNPKGGVGKTTTATTLAHLLFLEDKGVALVDLDSWRTRGAGAKAAFRRGELLGIPTFERLEDLAEPEPNFIIIDTPPDSPSAEQAKAQRVADLVIVPMSVSDDDLEVSIAHFVSINNANKMLLLTRIHPRSHTASLVEDLNESGYPTFATVIRSYSIYKTALTSGGTVAGVNTVAGRKAAGDYQALLAEILGQQSES